MGFENTLVCYKFKVTKTLQNGNERTETKCVYSHGVLTYEQVEKAKAVLKSDHFYNIEMISCKYMHNSYFVD